MPVYEYVCTQCGRGTEVMHGFNTSGPTSCEVCGGRLRKAVSTPAIVFKGTGWAKKDARTSAFKKSEAATDAPAGNAPERVTTQDTSSLSGDGAGASRAEGTEAPRPETLKDAAEPKPAATPARATAEGKKTARSSTGGSGSTSGS